MAYQTFLAFQHHRRIIMGQPVCSHRLFFWQHAVRQTELSLVVIALVLIPGIPALIEFMRLFLERRNKSKNPQTER